MSRSLSKWQWFSLKFKFFPTGTGTRHLYRGKVASTVNLHAWVATSFDLDILSAWLHLGHNGYLLDSNHVYDYYRQKNSAVVEKILSLPTGSIILGCAISLGEIAAGHKMPHHQTARGQAIRDEYVAWLHEKFSPYAKSVTVTTGNYYAELMGRIWRLNRPPQNGKRGTELHLLYSGADHEAGLAHFVSKGVDIYDVWQAAVAWEHGLAFVTTDDMGWIREAAGVDIAWECWIPKSKLMP